MKNKLLKIFLAALLLRIILAFWAWHPDVNNHIDWGIRFFEYGPGKFFSPETNVWSYTWPNQPPGTIYLFALIRKLFEWVFSFFWFLNVNIPPFPSNLMLFFETNLYPALLKLPAILADFGIAYIIYRFFNDKKKRKAGIFGAILFLLNPVIWYNSALWGQTDAIINFFALLAFYLVFRKKLVLAFLAFGLSLYIKAPLLIYAPIFAVLVLRKKFEVSQIVKGIVISLLFLGILTLPFSQGEPFSFLYEIYTKKVFTQQLHIITANAFNLWALIAGIHQKSNSLLLGPLSYENWGILLYGITYLPALYLVYKKQDEESVFWSLAIVSFSTFMLLTNMHERYLYHFFPVATYLVAKERRLLSIYIGISLISLLNLYNFWWMPRFEPLVDLLSARDRLLPRILGGINFGLFSYFYYKFFRQNKPLKL